MGSAHGLFHLTVHVVDCTRKINAMTNILYKFRPLSQREEKEVQRSWPETVQVEGATMLLVGIQPLQLLPRKMIPKRRAAIARGSRSVS